MKNRDFSFIQDADMAELADALDLGSSGRPCRFKSCYPHYFLSRFVTFCDRPFFLLNDGFMINEKELRYWKGDTQNEFD